MGRVNTTIDIYRKPFNPILGESATLVGNYEAWIEERIFVVDSANDLSIPATILEQAKGLGIIWEDIDLTNCYIVYNTVEYEITQFFAFRTAIGFHHKEFIYA